ncbi:hypothetical protein DRN86_01125 [Candidatus Geothermarchaeota archaeon]|nr:MAG: hypothetical protein DRN86_01125 [Candidatus Geothermarchaeota archaeon]
MITLISQILLFFSQIKLYDLKISRPLNHNNELLESKNKMIVRNHFYFIVFLSVDEAIKSLRILESHKEN